ncbi:MAG: hypothetical protein HYW88_03135 [Candidatus Sungbacteria bacterium]|nr:hypothetical protein [Candidatus Sungbacteria bacterium]
MANTLQGRTTYVNGAQNEVRGIIEDSVRVAGGLIAVGGNADFNIHVETREYNRNTPWIQGGSFGNTQAVVLEVRIIRRADNVLIFRGSDERSFDQQYGQYARERATIDAVREALANLY